MDRQMVVNLIRNRMVECPKGRTRVWVTRCFEITVRPGRMVEVDEYEACEVCEGKSGVQACNGPRADFKSLDGVFHVGRSVISLNDGRVVEETVKKERGRPAKIQLARKSPPAPVTV